MRKEISVSTSQRIEMKEITRPVQHAIADMGLENGVCLVFCPHTTAGLAINENADPDVCSDLVRAFEAAVPKVRFDHAEGNSPAHFLSCLTGASLHVIVEAGRLRLGRWQGLFFCEFDGPRRRIVWVKALGRS